MVKALIIGVDAGGSMTKAVALEDSKILGTASTQTVEPKKSAEEAIKLVVSTVGLHLRDVEKVAVSGGGSRRIDSPLLGLPTVMVDEITAIGFGGVYLTKKERALIVSVGTGTAMVVVYDGGRSIRHIGGTGVGGGTILGLAKRMLGVVDFKTLEDMASRGDAEKVDLTVRDIAGGPVGIIPAEATASNFGRLTGEEEPNDIAAAIFNMVSQVVGVLAAMAARAYNLREDVVFVGKPVQSRIIAENLRRVAELFNIGITIPEDGEYCTALGAAGYVARRSTQ
ncbi:hypothetical protein DRO55_00690 [Candidatus Bathyarchaeota archaeon]|nr:MAG: hypothetical protein DRO55_00690 [Candidatus Bathyarchaeota archaeon]